MGQGYSMTTLSAASATIDIPELSDLTHDKIHVSTRFTKSIRAKSHQGFVFVKALMKPYSAFDVRTYVKQLTDERNALAAVPNALGYQRIVEVATGGYLVRQYMYTSVYDRLSTRPFLEDIEKRWLAYQLLCSIRDCHAQNVYHGDIKTENLLVTSWNWLYLSDFSSSFKPTCLPEDNPADFSFYFDSSSRRICYIAPERFSSQAADEAPQGLTWAMDMFSVGCVIAEMFTEGPIFTLSQIFKYRSGEYNPEHAHISKIEDDEVRAMILNMIELDPEKRYSAEQHLSFYKAKIFPEYFYSFLHDYMSDLTDPVSFEGQVVLDGDMLFESDRKIERVYNDFDKIAYFLGYSESLDIKDAALRPTRSRSKALAGGSGNHIENALHDGTLLFLTLVSSAIRNTSKASARLKACDLLASFAERLPDEAKLDRILPYVVALLDDRSDAVKVAALHATTSILASVKVVSPINAYLFPVYIFGRLEQFLNIRQNLTGQAQLSMGQGQPSTLVRAAFASCLTSLALASGRMLDMIQALRADGRMSALSNETWVPNSSFHGLYDVARAELVSYFEEATTLLITDVEGSVRRALLGSISRLCMFFESSKASDVILSHLNTYVNEPDWMLRCSFYEALVGVATYVGTSSLEQFIVPIMIGSMIDEEHFVVERVIRSFGRMAALGLFQKSMLWELSGLISRYLVHPSVWVREAAAQFIEQSCKYLSTADRYCIIMPILQPFLRGPLLDFSEAAILDKLKPPITRAIFDAAVVWASRREKSLFWTAASQDRVFMVAHPEASFVASNFTKRFPQRIPPSHKDKDDQQSLETLRNFGMVPDDEVKLMALREYILKLAQRKSEASMNDRQRMLSDIVSLSKLDVSPQNIFFDAVQPYRPAKKPKSKTAKAFDIGQPRTIADALLDASIGTDSTNAGRLDTNKAQPVSISVTGASQDADELTRMSHKNASVDRPNIKIESIKDERTARSSSVGGRHSLLDTERLSAERRESNHLKPRNSSFNLLNRAETMKAEAEISTSQETAFGKLDRSPSERIGTNKSSLTHNLNIAVKSRSKSPTYRAQAEDVLEPNHSYEGNEPAVMRLLDNHLYHKFPMDLYDFGPSHTVSDIEGPIKTAFTSLQQSLPGTNGTVNGNKTAWRPAGLLLAQFTEHTAAINRVLAPRDHSFFVTASDDGTCKIWDTSRLEKNVSARSRHTHRHAAGAKVKSLCFVEDTHTFISGASDGSIHALRLEVVPGEGKETSRFSKPALVRDWLIPQDSGSAAKDVSDGEEVQDREHATYLHHYNEHDSKSILLVATNLCRILMVDMRSMEVIHTMHNPYHHGTPTTFCIDKQSHWLLLGTTLGIVDLWDLRFKLRLRSFGIGGAGLGRRIDSLLLHPSRGHGKWAIVSCGGEISVWDIEKSTCREVLRPSSFRENVSRKVKNYEPWLPDEESNETVLQRLGAPGEASETTSRPSMNPTHDMRPGSSSSATSTLTPNSITSILTFSDHLANSAQPGSPNKATLMLSVGDDRTLRYWDFSHVDRSFIVSGPMINVVGEENRIKPRYETSWPTSMSLSGLVQLVEEKLSDASQNDVKEGTSSARSTPRKQRETASRSSKQANDTGKATTGTKTPRNTIISTAQEQLLKTHMDEITDVCLLKKPYGCIVTVDRGGAIFVFH